ncbi:MAG: carbohydrate kinase family protein [Acidobacteriota bacterium]
MVFPGKFQDHILPEKLHVINISFLVQEMRRMRGGCAGNISYSMALLGHGARVLATAGSDFSDYADWLEKHGVDLGGVKTHDDIATASCFITTDQTDNQITGFFPGAMGRAGELSLAELRGENAGLLIVAPDDPAAMMRHCREARELGLPFVFDPSFQVTAMEGEDLAEAARGAAMMVLNDYEFAVFCKKTGVDEETVFDLVDMVVVTLGGEGSKILRRGESDIAVPAAKIGEFVDPTGAGDSYRSGFLIGLANGFDLEVCGRMGSIASAYVVEQNGPQSHAYSLQDFIERYRENFGPLPKDLAT